MANVIQTVLNLVAGKQTVQSAAIVSTPNTLVQMDGNGFIDPSILPAGLGPELIIAPTTENLVAGALVNVYSNAGVLSVRNADASTTGKEARGFVQAAVTSPANATVYELGKNGQVTGLTIGSDYFLSTTTPGAVQTTAPSTPGQISQRVGRAISATNLDVVIREPFYL